MTGPSEYTQRCRRRAAEIHAENRARMQREREEMARRWQDLTPDVAIDRPECPDPESALAAAFAAMGRDFGGDVVREAS